MRACYLSAPRMQTTDIRKGQHKGVPEQTVFLRDIGWIDDKKEDTWGEIIGSPSDEMLLSDTKDVYIQLEEGHDTAGVPAESAVPL